MKKLLILSVIALTAAPAYACKYAPISHRSSLSTTQRVELQQDQQVVDQLRRDMNTVCTNSAKVAITSCQYNQGPCADLPYDLKDKFKYDFGADGSLTGMVSPEDRTKNAETITRLYNKWKS